MSENEIPEGAIRYRKRKATRITSNSSWNWGAEPGDLCVDFSRRLLRITESRGRNMRDAGMLTTIQIHPPRKGMVAVIVQSEIYWVPAPQEGNGDE